MPISKFSFTREWLEVGSQAWMQLQRTQHISPVFVSSVEIRKEQLVSETRGKTRNVWEEEITTQYNHRWSNDIIRKTMTTDTEEKVGKECRQKQNKMDKIIMKWERDHLLPFFLCHETFLKIYSLISFLSLLSPLYVTCLILPWIPICLLPDDRRSNQSQSRADHLLSWTEICIEIHQVLRRKRIHRSDQSLCELLFHLLK